MSAIYYFCAVVVILSSFKPFELFRVFRNMSTYLPTQILQFLKQPIAAPGLLNKFVVFISSDDEIMVDIFSTTTFLKTL